MNRPRSENSKDRVAKHRAAMRAKGYRLKQFWLPDVRTPEFREQARRDMAAIEGSAGRQDDIDFAEAVQYWPEEDDD
jgi:ABC-type branched-subunit amino acid transport system substrate-binding protein